MNRFVSTCFVFTIAKMSAGNISLSLNSFLTSTKNIINNTVEKTSKPNITCVIGNESCDLDSAVSSITYSYFLFSNLVGRVSDNKVDVILPVLNVERKNFPVKTEVKYFLNANNISENDLVFRDEIDLINLNEEKRLKLVLVDHHVLQKDYEGLEDSVIKVLDHRPKDKKSKWTDAIARIETVGSCSTLVADEIIKADELILANNRDVATLLFGTIVLDTFCFSETTKRYTPLDREIADKCKLLGKIEQSEENLCETLTKSKNDVSKLTLEQLLVKDMKLVKFIPISTLTTSVKRFLNKEDSLNSLKSFCKEYDTPLSILLGVEWDGDEHRRDVYIFCNDELAAANETVKDPSQLAEFIVKHLFNYTLMDLVFIENVHTGVLYKQNNTTLTRKHMLPIVENALNDFILSSDKQ